MARRNDHTHDQLKKMILDTAWRIIRSEGVDGVTARRVAMEIGYVPGTIYNVFNSMDDLYLEINGRTFDLLSAVLNSPVCNNPKKTPVQNMKKMADLYMKFARDYRPYWLMLFSRSLPVQRAEQAWYRAKIDRLFDPLEGLLQPLFSSHQTRKRKMAARALWAAVHGLCFLEETGKTPLVGGQPPLEVASYLIDSFVVGISVQK